MSSPLIIERKKDPGGVLGGKAAMREYRAIGLAAVPPLEFELIDVHVGVDTIGILLRSIGRRRERLVQMIERRTTDPLWSVEYAKFVHDVSFARPDESISFVGALEGVKRLVKICKSSSRA
jgi:hypothetical protein